MKANRAPHRAKLQLLSLGLLVALSHAAIGVEQSAECDLRQEHQGWPPNHQIAQGQSTSEGLARNTQPPVERWASPRELRGKKLIGGGLYTTNPEFGSPGSDTAVNPRFLAAHPEFADSYPFDGIVLPAVLSPEWVASLGLTKGANPWRPNLFHFFLWTTVLIPDEAVAQTIADLNTMRRGSLTDNFLICGMLEGSRGRNTPDLANDADWAILEQNARLAARICRDGKLKGLWLDTEQYTNYRWRAESGPVEFDATKPQELPFPLGKDTEDVLRRRGAQWIRAIQAEFPEVVIMTTFAWSEDAISYGPLKGTIPFLDGVLEGIQSPGKIVHGHENTFYFGHGPGTTHAYAHEHGIPGSRAKYEGARAAIRGWRALSSNPTKYDSFVQVGMAAWIEDHPWGVPPGTPIGSKRSLWSNLPLALAYSDEYVWSWAESTHYGQSTQGEINPFLASLNNQTFNTGSEAVATFDEVFATNPLRHGWYFDFDMLAIGCKAEPEHEARTMSTGTVPYGWDPESKTLRVHGDNPSRLYGQRRRFVRPLVANATHGDFHAVIAFQVDSFGSDRDNPMILGLFNSDIPINERSLTLQIAGPNRIHLAIASKRSNLAVPMNMLKELQSGQTYQLTLDYASTTHHLLATLSTVDSSDHWASKIHVELPASLSPITADEIGIAISENRSSSQSANDAYDYRITKVAFHP